MWKMNSSVSVRAPERKFKAGTEDETLEGGILFIQMT